MKPVPIYRRRSLDELCQERGIKVETHTALGDPVQHPPHTALRVTMPGTNRREAWVELRLDENGELKLWASSTLHITPHSGNVVIVRAEGF